MSLTILLRSLMSRPEIIYLITSTNQQRQFNILQIYLQIIKKKIRLINYLLIQKKSNYHNNLSLQKSKYNSHI
jgi:hypothetical protein